MPSSTPQPPLLSVRDLRTYYHTEAGFVRAVDGISFDVPRGGTVGIAGESGCGKTQTALSILGLIDDAPGLVGGQIWMDGENLLRGLETYCTRREDADGLTVTKDVERWRTLHHRRMAPLRGTTVSMVFQEPRGSLIPYRTVGQHLHETMAARNGKAAAQTYEAPALALLQRLRFAHPERVLRSYPHELSGGESQRVMLGLALIGQPRLLIADEPTTLLDAVTQRSVLDMLTTVAHEMKLALLLITHNLALLRLLVDRVVIMFAGTIVEQGPTATLINPTHPCSHPYTQDLLRAGGLSVAVPPSPQPSPEGVPRAANRPGCCYYHRCSLKDHLSDAVRARCRHETPPPFTLDDNHTVACWAYEEAA